MVAPKPIGCIYIYILWAWVLPLYTLPMNDYFLSSPLYLVATTSHCFFAAPPAVPLTSLVSPTHFRLFCAARCSVNLVSNQPIDPPFSTSIQRLTSLPVNPPAPPVDSHQNNHLFNHQNSHFLLHQVTLVNNPALNQPILLVNHPRRSPPLADLLICTPSNPIPSIRVLVIHLSVCHSSPILTIL